jgi:hypothetical protein
MDIKNLSNDELREEIEKQTELADYSMAMRFAQLCGLMLVKENKNSYPGQIKAAQKDFDTADDYQRECRGRLQRLKKELESRS